MAHEHVPHWGRKGPPKVADASAVVHGTGRAGRFNAWLAVKVTSAVGTMWCAYAFVALAVVSLPAAVRSGDAVILVSWVSQTFLQLVLLSVIIVGQNVQAAASDQRAEATYRDAEAVLAECLELQQHLQAQDAILERLIHSPDGKV